jgi:hypothetical protein
MTTLRIPSAASARRWLPIVLLTPFLAFAQAPAPSEPKAAPADAKEDAKDAAPAPAAGDAAKDAGKAKTPPSARSAPPGIPEAPNGPLAPLAWLSGCWWGDVNQHEFREYWHPLAGDAMVGVSRMVRNDKVLSYEYLRLEQRADGIYYVAAPKGKPETAFKYSGTAKDANEETFTFTAPGTGFPTTLVYRRAGGGWLYIDVAGSAKGKDHKVTYPFRRVSCETGEFIRK